MPRPSTAILVRRLGSANLFGFALVVASTAPTSAGPLSDHFKLWSANRQQQVRVEKPFSHHSSQVNLNEPSMAQKFRKRLTLHPSDSANSHQIKTDVMKHERGVLQH